MTDIIAIASDHAGFNLKEILKAEITSLGYEVLDLGTNSRDPVDYPDYGAAIAHAVRDGQAKFGVAVCGSGIGISIAANRFPEIRAALCWNGSAAQLSREHDDANVLCLGARLIGEEVAKDCLRKFLSSKFAEGRHVARVAKLSCPRPPSK